METKIDPRKSGEFLFTILSERIELSHKNRDVHPVVYLDTHIVEEIRSKEPGSIRSKSVKCFGEKVISYLERLLEMVSPVQEMMDRSSFTGFPLLSVSVNKDGNPVINGILRDPEKVFEIRTELERLCESLEDHRDAA